MNEIQIELKKLNMTKGNTFRNISAKLLKLNSRLSISRTLRGIRKVFEILRVGDIVSLLKKYIQLNSCNPNSYNSNNHVIRTNYPVPQISLSCMETPIIRIIM